MAALEKAMFFDPNEPSSCCFYVQFNPNSLEYSYGKKHHKKGAKESGQEGDQQSPLDTQEQARLSMSLFFNTYDSETSYTDVRKKLLPLRAFLCKTEDKETANGKTVMFAWGTLAFRGSMDSFSVTYQMFAADGTPVRAEVRVSISGEDAEAGAAAPAKKTQDTNGEAGGDDLNWLFEEE